MTQDSLFDQPAERELTRDEVLAIDLGDLVTLWGFDAVEAALGRIKIQMAGPVGAAPARPSDPRTSHAAARQNIDVRRFSAKSYAGKLLAFFVMVSSATDKQATDHVMGSYAEIARWEGCRRRCSDLRAAGYIKDTGAEYGGRIVWEPTPEGRAAFHRMQTTGWSR
jgi:hypothetical protein